MRRPARLGLMYSVWGAQIICGASLGRWSRGITNYVDSTVSYGVFYAYRVRATNAVGHSIWSCPLERVAGTLEVDAWGSG